MIPKFVRPDLTETVKIFKRDNEPVGSTRARDQAERRTEILWGGDKMINASSTRLMLISIRVGLTLYAFDLLGWWEETMIRWELDLDRWRGWRDLERLVVVSYRRVHRGLGRGRRRSMTEKNKGSAGTAPNLPTPPITALN